MVDSDPKFEARPNGQLGESWCVYVVWRSGKTDVVTGFQNQYSALKWIREESANWVVEKIMQRPS